MASRRRLKAAAATLSASLLVLLAAFLTGSALSPPGDAPDVEGGMGTSAVEVSVSAPGWDGSGGPVAVAVTGFTADGEGFAQQALVTSPDAPARVEVGAGEYAVASTMPAIELADGTVLRFQGAETVTIENDGGCCAAVEISFAPAP